MVKPFPDAQVLHLGFGCWQAHSGFRDFLWYTVVYMCWYVFRVYCVQWYTVVYGCWYVFKVYCGML